MNPRTLPTIAVIGAAVLALTACDAVSLGPRSTEDRPIDEVTALELRTSGDVTITQGGTASLSVTAAEDVLSRLTSEVRDGVLVLGVDQPGMFGTLGRVQYDLVLPDLEAVRITGSGDVSADTAGAQDLAVLIEGSGSVDVDDVEVTTVTVRIAGSGDVELDGRAADLQVTIDGSGSFEGEGLTSKDAVVAIQGSGDAAVDVTGKLEASIAGSGSITHTGGASVTSDVDGSGQIREG